MMQVFRYGIDITRHHLKGLYVVALGKVRSTATDEGRFSSSKRNVQVICTLRDGPADDCEDWNLDEEEAASSPKNSPITLTYKGQQTTLRPWDPSRCPLAASIHNRLIHFPIQPNSNVFAISLSLHSLSHISDTLGPFGSLIAVLSGEMELKPETLHRFIMRHRNTTVIFEDIAEASLERYQRLLSLPDDSRWAFLMAMHPRLGANSPARLLKPEAEKICNIIFDFLVCTTPSQIKSLVMWQGPSETQEDRMSVGIFDQVLKHINILERWRKLKKPKEKTSEGEFGHDKDHQRIWVIMDMSTKVTTHGNLLDFKLVNEMAKIGMLAKEQLALSPWFPDRSLLLFKYAVHQGDRQVGQALTSGSERPGGADDKERRKEARAQKSQRPPSAVSMPVPSFGLKGPREEKEFTPATSRLQAEVPVQEEDPGALGGGQQFHPKAPQPPQPWMSQMGPEEWMEQDPSRRKVSSKKRQNRQGGTDFGPPGLTNQAQSWLGSEESQLLSNLKVMPPPAPSQAAGPGPGPSMSRMQWAGPPGLHALHGYPDQALPAHAGLPAQAQQAQWQAQAHAQAQAAQMFPMNMGPPGTSCPPGGGKGQLPWPHGMGGQMNQPQLPFNFTEDQMNFMPLNL